MDLVGELEELADRNGADFYGIADLRPYSVAIEGRFGTMATTYPFAISIGIRLLDTIVDMLPDRSDRAVRVSYRSHAYDVINDRLDQMTSLISSRIQRMGYRAFPVPSSERVDDETISALFSHKMAAHLAGLGWIGKSCLLITPEHGPRVRWATILTDAPFTDWGVPMDQQCGECERCVTLCPQGALTGRPFLECEPREMRFDAKKCDRYFKEMENEMQKPVCGLCLFVCPHGRKAGH